MEEENIQLERASGNPIDESFEQRERRHKHLTAVVQRLWGLASQVREVTPTGEWLSPRFAPVFEDDDRSEVGSIERVATPDFL